VPPDRRRTAPEAGGQGETRSGAPTKKTKYGAVTGGRHDYLDGYETGLDFPHQYAY
jgi:hypothetical protein